MKKLFFPTLCSVIFLSSMSAQGQTLSKFDLPTESKISLKQLRFNNFFQAPDGRPKEDVDATRFAIDVITKFTEKQSWRYYGRGEFTAYNKGLDETALIQGGARYLSGPHELDVGLKYERKGISFDVGDEFDNSNNIGTYFTYEYRLNPDWEITALGEVTYQDFSSRDGSKDSVDPEIGGEVKYRGWGYKLMPSIGLAYKKKNSDDSDSDYDQQEAYIKIETVPLRKLYLSARYRYRNRDYPIADPTGSNFDREDKRHQITVSADYRFSERFEVNLYYDQLDSDSTKSSRTFTTDLIILGASIFF